LKRDLLADVRLRNQTGVQHIFSLPRSPILSAFLEVLQNGNEALVMNAGSIGRVSARVRWPGPYRNTGTRPNVRKSLGGRALPSATGKPRRDSVCARPGRNIRNDRNPEEYRDVRG
jgi:hypothetical protein